MRPQALFSAALLALAVPGLLAAKVIVPNGDGVCLYDWTSDYDQLTRLTNFFDPALGDGDAKTLLVAEATAGQLGQLKETWYVARDPGVCPAGSADLYRTFAASLQDWRDSPLPNESPAYAVDATLGCPWTSASLGGLSPMTRYFKGATNDHRTWLPGAPTEGYAANATWSTATPTPRLGYPRFGNLLGRDDVLAAAYGTWFLDNGVLRVDFNKIWGNAIGRITQVASGRQIVFEPIGDMVQTVARWGTGDPDCRTPNPTQSGGVNCTIMLPDGSLEKNQQLTERWAGSPVLSTSVSGTEPRTLTTVVRPFDYCHNGQDQRTVEHWVPQPDRFSPLAWRGLFQRSDTLSCKLGGATRRDILKTSSRVKLAEGAVIASQTLGTLNTHWLQAGVIGDARVAGQVKIEEVNLETGAVTQVPFIYDAANNRFVIENDPVNGGKRLNPGHDIAWMVTKGDGSFGYAVARLDPRPDDALNVSFHCGATCSPESVAIVLQANRSANQINAAGWNDPIESFLIVNNRSAILNRLGELESDGGNCDS